MVVMPYKDPEKKREYARQWVQKHSEKMKEHRKRWRESHREHLRAYAKEYDSRPYVKERKLPRQRLYQQRYFQYIKKKALDLLDWKCVYCGCDIPELLEVNHKEIGTGRNRHSKMSSIDFYSKIVNGQIPLDTVERTCKICNTWHYCQKKYGDTGHRVIWSKLDRLISSP